MESNIQNQLNGLKGAILMLMDEVERLRYNPALGRPPSHREILEWEARIIKELSVPEIAETERRTTPTSESTCGSSGRGGGGKREYASNAERQRAYRERKVEDA